MFINNVNGIGNASGITPASGAGKAIDDIGVKLNQQIFQALQGTQQDNDGNFQLVISNGNAKSEAAMTASLSALNNAVDLAGNLLEAAKTQLAADPDNVELKGLVEKRQEDYDKAVAQRDGVNGSNAAAPARETNFINAINNIPEGSKITDEIVAPLFNDFKAEYVKDNPNAHDSEIWNRMTELLDPNYRDLITQ